jgi:hypothetical protein
VLRPAGRRRAPEGITRRRRWEGRQRARGWRRGLETSRVAAARALCSLGRRQAWCGSPPSPSGGGGAPAAAGSCRRTSLQAVGGLPDMARGRWGDDIRTRWALAEPSPFLWIQRNGGATRFWRCSCSCPLRRPFRDKVTPCGSRDFSRTPVWVVLDPCLTEDELWKIFTMFGELRGLNIHANQQYASVKFVRRFPNLKPFDC